MDNFDKFLCFPKYVQAGSMLKEIPSHPIENILNRFSQ